MPENMHTDEAYQEWGGGAPGQPSAHGGGEWGDMIVGCVQYPAGFDAASMLRGFPDGYCPCPHWGYVLSGTFVVRYADHEETFTRGDAYYLAPGHAPRYLEETEVFEVSPADALHQVIEVITTCRIDAHPEGSRERFPLSVVRGNGTHEGCGEAACRPPSSCQCEHAL